VLRGRGAVRNSPVKHSSDTPCLRRAAIAPLGSALTHTPQVFRHYRIHAVVYSASRRIGLQGLYGRSLGPPYLVAMIPVWERW